MTTGPEGGAADLFFYVSVTASRANSSNWGDTQYAEGLLRALCRFPGCAGEVIFRDERPHLIPGRDVVLRIIGPHPDEPMPGVPNLLWMISPPNFMAAATLARYQGVFCASSLFTLHLRQQGVAAEFMPQATETDHFHPGRRRPGAPDLPIVFVGAHALRADRRLVLQAVKDGHDVRIWGPGWQGVVPDHCVQGERLTYDELAETYAAARIVLNSHMPQMAARGFMSNRSFDALASGARVISDHIPGFVAPDLPELACVSTPKELNARITEFLALGPADHQTRQSLLDRTSRGFGFQERAARFVAAARAHLAAGRISARPRDVIALRPVATPVDDSAQQPAQAQPVRAQTAQAQPVQAAAVLAAARAILSLARAYPQASAAPRLDLADEVLHPMMPYLREMQSLLHMPVTAQAQGRVDDLCAMALRLTEVLEETAVGLALTVSMSERDAVLARLIRNQPHWAHSPDDYQREHRKVHLALQPRRDPPPSDTPLGVFIHLYYEDLAAAFARRLALIDAPVRLYVSTDTDAKAAEIARHLPTADVRVMPNRGRDIWPKLYGFGDVYDRHEVVLHLHGKKSSHSDRLDDWLEHILSCLLGSREEVNRILSLFQSIPKLGIVAPLAFRSVMGAAHWGANHDIGRELAFRMNLPGPLPDNAGLQFPIGSMFWGRTAAIRPLLDLNLRQKQFPPEAQQVDGTVAHAIERMLGVVCQATGHHILPVSGASQTLHSGFRHRFKTNRDLREALEAGLFRPG